MAGQKILQEENCEILRHISRHINRLRDGDKIARKKTLHDIRRELFLSRNQCSDHVFDEVFDLLLKPLLKCFSDPVEKNRELAIQLTWDILEKVHNPDNALHYLVPTLAQQLGNQDITEQSEENRLLLVKLLAAVFVACPEISQAYLNDIVLILQQTIVDPFPEVKQESCHCATLLARAMPQHFHMQAESLIPSLLKSLTHQHSKVRVAVINAIGKHALNCQIFLNNCYPGCRLNS